MKKLKIALVAGEASGDILGASLMAALKEQAAPTEIEFIGVGGALMQEQGLTSAFPMDRLSVMGLVEVLGRLPELILKRRRLIKQIAEAKPDVFIGIDSPDFTLNMELRLREQGIKTVHYVSPSVWAWRQKRVFKVQKACDLMLCLLPFEADFYKEHRVPVRFVGHPLADAIALDNDQSQARQQLEIAQDAQLVALMPGSRGGEVAKLGELFVQAAEQIVQQRTDVQFVLPAANASRYEQLQQILAAYPHLPIKLIQGRSQLALQACDAVLIASGTATLEAMLFKRPMVVAYRVAGLTYRILKRLVKTPYFSLPNLLAGRGLVPEYIQHAATPQTLGDAVLSLLDESAEQTEHFMNLHQSLKLNASQQAASAVLELISAGQVSAN